MCMSLTHRLQLLIDDAQYDRLARQAQVEGRSIGALVRHAIDMAWAEPDARKRSAADLILDAESMDVPDPEQLRRELEDARGGRFT